LKAFVTLISKNDWKM